MANLFVKVIFGVLNFISKFFLDPVINAISSIIPSFSTYVSYFLNFLGNGLNYVAFFIKLFMIPSSLIMAVITLSMSIFSVVLVLRVIGLGTSIYHYFKP